MNETRRDVLAALADGPISGPELADALGVSRAAVWKHVDALREDGFAVESTDDGYALAGVPEYGAAAVEFGLDAPFEIEHHDALPSTNDRARELAADGASDVVVLADRQTGGRGRRGREWSSPGGGVWVSIVLRPALPPARIPLLTLAAAVAVTDAARDADVDAAIKWPNDVVVPGSDENEPVGDDPDQPGDLDQPDDPDQPGNPDQPDDDTTRGGAKLAGVLTEMEGEASRVSWVVVGIGANVNVDRNALAAGATSVLAETGCVPRREFVQSVLQRFHDLRDDPDRVLAAWRERAATLGERVRVETANGDVVGEAVDVTEHGALVVDTGDGERVVHAGDCEHLRPA